VAELLRVTQLILVDNLSYNAPDLLFDAIHDHHRRLPSCTLHRNYIGH